MTPSNPTKISSPINQTFNSSRDPRVTAMPAASISTMNIQGSCRDRSAERDRERERDRQIEETSERHFYDDRKLTHDILVALLILVAMLIPVVILEFVVEPFQRGFFCNDESIQYPSQANTVGFTMLVVILMVFPIPLIFGIEMLLYHRQGKGSKEYIICFGKKVPVWLFASIRHYFFYVFGMTAVLDITEIGKFTIGRLRPHFMAVCQPELPDGSTCNDLKNQNKYIQEYICVANGFELSDVRQSRLSFPSGHASLTLFSMIYLVLYMEMKMKTLGPKILRHFIQLILLMFAWFTSLSRVMDYWHHWSDVLIGMLFGTVGAILSAKYVTKLFHYDHNSPTSFRLNGIHRHDTTATLHDVL